MDAFEEPGVEVVVLMWSSQVGKTSGVLCLVGYHMAHDPCTILVVNPTIDPMARAFARERLDPMIRASPTLSAVVDRRRSADGTNTTLSKTFRGGILALAGANSPASLAARAIRLLVEDEIDRYPAEIATEGSTIDVVERRTQTYRQRRRVLKISTPTLDTAPINIAFKRGDQRYFHVPCPSCDDRHPYRWENVAYPPGKPHLAHFVCPACDYPLSDAERIAALDDGEWLPSVEPTDPTCRSYHLWSGYSPLVHLGQLARDYEAARQAAEAGDAGPYKTFVQTVLGQPIGEDDVVESPALSKLRQSLLDRRGKGPPMPNEVRVVAAVDIQKDRAELLVSGFAPDEESWLLHHEVIAGAPDDAALWTGLDEARSRTYSGLHIETLFIDSGYSALAVYDYCMPRAPDRVFPLKGYADRPFVSHVRKPEPGPRGRKCLLFLVGVDEGKSLVMSRLGKDPGPGAIHLPDEPWCDEEFVAQATSEQLTRIRSGGRTKLAWQQIRQRNEGLDLLVYVAFAQRWLPR